MDLFELQKGAPEYYCTSVAGGGGAVDSASSVNSSARSPPLEETVGLATAAANSLD
jgi:hypothetical protein